MCHKFVSIVSLKCTDMSQICDNCPVRVKQQSPFKNLQAGLFMNLNHKYMYILIYSIYLAMTVSISL